MNEIPNLNCENIPTTLEFEDVPEFINISNQSLHHLAENPNELSRSEIILEPDKNKFSLKKRFSMKLNIQDIIDWVTK
jgi:hypothetical protein